MRAAMEAGDREAASELLAPGVVLRSPILGRNSFEGKDAVSRLFGAVIDSFEGLEYTSEMADSDWDMLGFRARVLGQEIEGVDLLRTDQDDRVVEIKLMIRPMAGLAAVGAALGPRIARGPAQRALIRLNIPLLRGLMALQEALAPRLTRMQS